MESLGVVDARYVNTWEEEGSRKNKEGKRIKKKQEEEGREKEEIILFKSSSQNIRKYIEKAPIYIGT